MQKFLNILFSSLMSYIVVIFIGAYLTLRFEEVNKSSNIKDYKDALWWSINATSIGNSNVYPITDYGKITGVFLIIIGYGLFTINVATISSFLNHLLNDNLKKIEKSIHQNKS